MRKNLASLCVILTLLIAFYGCRKYDQPNPPATPVTTVEKFFTANRSADQTEKALVDFLIKKNEALGFVNKTVERIGIPFWNKMITSSRKSQTTSRGNNGDSLATIYYVPFARETQNFVNAAMVIKTTKTDTSFYYVNDWLYSRLENNESGLNDAAEKFAIFFMVMNKEVFGHKYFKILDSTIFKSQHQAAKFVTLDSVTAGSSLTGRQVTYCRPITIYFVDCPYATTASSGHPCYPTCDACFQYCLGYLSYNYCWEEWIDDSNGGGGTGGGGTGGGGGGTPTDPCDPGISRNPDPCETDPGWEPTPSIDPTNPVNNTPYLKNATFAGTSTYITSAGVPVTLPAGTQVKFYTNVDINIFPNGALYAFILPNGKEYIAIQKEYLQPGGIAVPKPEFTGYYKINPDTRKVDYHSPLPAGTFTVAQPVNGVVRAVRMRVQKTASNTCEMVRELVDYSPVAGLPTSYTTSANVNYNVEYLSAVAGTTPEATPLTNCPGGSMPGNTSTSLTLSTYVLGTSSLSTFLQDNVKSDVKIYLYDCATNAAQYTITKTGYATVPTAQQTALITKFDNGVFNATDEHIAIKACMQNGQWNYDVKFNLTRLGVLHPKIESSVGAVLAEIRYQADQEAQAVRGVERQSSGEVIIANDGEKFYKQNMDLFKSISAIYDIGKHIVNNGEMPEYIWDQGFRAGPKDLVKEAAYAKSPYSMPSGLAGSVNQLIDEATGAVQLVKMGLEAIRRPRATFDNIYNSIKTLNKDKIKQIVSSASGYDNYQAGGNRARYQGGKHAIQAAMILLGPVKALTKGSDVVKGAGDGMTGVQKFIPDGSTNHATSVALKNATDNNKLVRNFDDEKLLTENVINGENHVVVLDRAGEVYSAKTTHDINGVGDNVLKEASPDDVVSMHTDPTINNQVKTQPQQFIDGKHFERNINNDPTHASKVQIASGVNLTGFTKISQVQIKLPNGQYMVADNVWYKRVEINGQVKYDVVINESKLSNAAPFSANQNTMLSELSNGNTTFELRNIKFADDAVPLPQGAILDVKAFVKTVSDGTTGINNYTITKIP